MPTRKITDATAEAIPLVRAKLHLRLTTTSEDTLVSVLISAVRQQCEQLTQRTLVETEYEATFSGFGGGAYGGCWTRLPLPYGPLRQVTSVKYLDSAGAEQTLDPSIYVLDAYALIPAVQLAYGKGWPAVAMGRPDAVRIRYLAGYADAASLQNVPAPLVQWMLLQLANFYENREAVIAGAQVQPLPFADALLDTYRIVAF